MASGIYVIRNIINNKIYIGSSSNLIKRIRIHKSKLKSNKHHSAILQNSYNKYGEESFEYEIVEYVMDNSMLGDREQVWIDFFRPEFNVRLIATSNVGIKRSDEFRENCRKRMIGSIPWNKGKKGSIPWNKGLTSENDARVKSYGEKQSITKKKLKNEQ